MEELAGEFSNKFTRVPASVLDDFLRKVHSQALSATDVHEPLWREYFTRLRQFAEAGYAQKFSDARSISEFEIFRKVERNLAGFAAHKQHALLEELRGLLIDPNTGQKRNFQDFQAEAANILKLHNDTWLRVEATHATIAAQQIEAWQEIQARKALYPYLRYETAGDDRVRPKHKLLDGAVHHVDSEFWDVNFPPNGWRCRCKVVQVDKPGLDTQVNFTPDKGFRHNVGKTGQVVGTDHPYFDVPLLDGERITRQAYDFLADLDAADMLTLAGKKYAGKALPLTGVPGGTVRITMDNLRRIHRSPHPARDVRDKMLAALDVILPALALLGETRGAEVFYQYLIAILGDNFYFRITRKEAENLLTAITSTP